MNYQLVKCVFCKKVSQLKDWTTERQPCEMCGPHDYRICPICEDGDEGYPWTDVGDGEGEDCPKCNQEIGWCRRGCPGP